MKKIIGLSLLLGSLNLHAQEAQLEKNITEVQLGLFGLNVNNETKLINKLSVRVSAEFQVSIWDNFFINQANLIVYPTIEIEPKFYYNLNSRFKKDKNIRNNSANYFSLQLEYIPNWFVISNLKDVSLANQINIVPTYGFRRNISEKFNYEFKFGYGYGKIIDKNYNDSGRIIDLSFKLGYVF